MFPGKRRKLLDGHPVDSRSPSVGSDASPGRMQVLRSQNLLHHGLLPNASVLPVTTALTAAWPSGVVDCDVRRGVEASPFGSALPGIEASGVSVYTGSLLPPARRTVLWPLLTPRRVTPAGSPQVRTRCFPARPPHLPPRLDRRASLCGASSPHRVGLTMRFLSIGPPVSPSLPPPGRLPFRSWLQVVVGSCFHDRSSYRGLTPHLQRAHAGRTQQHAADGAARRS